MSTSGITVLICTYNGAKLLPPTLKHLAAQQMPLGLGWEILLISNGSTDDTLTVASQLWTELGSPAPLRVLNEPRPGKHHALPRGFMEANYPYICIVDDDNWLGPEYLRLAWEIIDANPAIGALGGVPEAVCEISPPEWFADYAGHYAIGPQDAESGDITWKQGFLCGAGCIIRQSAWQRVQAADFESILTKYQGVRVSGDDIEICYALVLGGYRIWFDDRLRFQHFISARRLTWNYIYNLHRSSAGADVDLSPYRHFLKQTVEAKPLVWLRDALYSSKAMVKNNWHALVKGNLKSAETAEGNREALEASYSRWVVQHYVEKQVKQDNGFERVKAFIERLRALPQ